MSTGTNDGGLDGLYPTTWDEYVGQDKAKRTLRISCKSAKARGVPLDHVLIASQHPGIGKTALALMIAREMDTAIVTVSGSLTFSEARLLLSRMEDNWILFIDEIHRLVDGGKGKAEWLLHYLENGTLLGPFGSEEAPRLTVIGATTDVGKLPKTLRDRFSIIPELVAYNDDQGAGIAMALAEKILTPLNLPLPSPVTAVEIARASSNRPRTMRRLVLAIRDLALADEIITCEDGNYEMVEVLDFAGLSPDGLPPEARAYLRVLYVDFHGQPTGVQLISARLGEVGSGLADIEQLLLDKGLVGTTKSGRMLTGPGMKRAKELAEAA